MNFQTIGANLLQSKWLLLALSAILLISYQNCSNSHSFESDGTLESTAPGGNHSYTPDNRNDPDFRNGPEDSIPDVGDDDSDDETDIDRDYDGKKIAFKCTTGAKADWNEASFNQASDLTLSNASGFIFKYPRPVKSVRVSNVSSIAIIVNKALQTSEWKHVSTGLSYLRSRNIDTVTDVSGLIASFASMNMGTVQNISTGYVCLSGNQIGTISDVSSGYVKIRGRGAAANSNTGHITKISNISGYFISLYGIETPLIEKVSGGSLIIRNSTIDSLENVSGNITLINSNVRHIKDASGFLRLKNSTVDSLENTDLVQINLP